MQSFLRSIKNFGGIIFRLIRDFVNYIFPKIITISKKTINWWRANYQKQSNKGKLILIGLTFVVLCCICSVPVAIISPSNPSLTPTSQIAVQNESENVLQTQVAQLVVTQNALLTAAVPAIIPSEENTTPITRPTDIPITSTPPTVSGPIQVTYIDVGQGDSILIKSPEGKYGLIDGGEEGSGALEYLQSHGVTSLDMVVATHPHSDHIGGLVNILSTLPVSKIITNGQLHTTELYEKFLDAALASKAEYTEVKSGDNITLGSLVFDVLHPGEFTGTDMNRNSLVIKLKYGQTTFLFMGDANNEADNEILSSGFDVHANIFKVGHHASSNSFTPEFIDAVKPQIAIYSAGVGNSYDHPASTTLDALESAGAQVYGTEAYGSITVISDGSTYNLEKEKEPVPAAIPAAIPAAPAAQIVDTSIVVLNLSNPVPAGSNSSISIKTAPGANCSISVVYKSGPSNAAGLGPQTANQNGEVSWRWKVGSRTSAGVWNINVSCSHGDKSSSISVPFEVTK